MRRNLRCGVRRRTIALAYGAACHGIFAVAILTMIAAMDVGMSRSMGAVPPPWSWLADLALLAQFGIGHSMLLSRRGRSLLAKLAPAPFGADLMPTTYVLIAALQLFALYALWTPSGVVWWRAQGAAFWLVEALYAAAWALLGKAMLDAGIGLQSGLIGWTAVWRGRPPRYPAMPERGLFRVIRQPIYAAFILTLWLVPVWTPDQLLLAGVLTAYCLAAPRLKERRFAALFGRRFAAYRRTTPYMLPRLSRLRRP